jgi:nucleoside-diphosphate-sugar epimerase
MNVLVTGGSGFIGTNLIEHVRHACPHWKLLSLDIRPPKLDGHASYWVKCDIMDVAELRGVFHLFPPEYVIHLAARTDMGGKTVNDYRANSVGTANVVKAIQSVGCVSRAIFASTQFVVGPGQLPDSMDEYRPYNVYGESKALAERAVKSADLGCIWTIIRPTNVWGPWHPRYPHEFWRVLKQGKYLHPGGSPVVRSYAYVGTVICQILRILGLPANQVDRRVLYVGEEPINLIEWVNAFSIALRGKKVIVIPRPILRMLALFGDVVNAAGGQFPIFSSRFRSMTENYPTPMKLTFDTLGEQPSALRDGVQETVHWLRAQSEFWH